MAGLADSLIGSLANVYSYKLSVKSIHYHITLVFLVWKAKKLQITQTSNFLTAAQCTLLSSGKVHSYESVAALKLTLRSIISTHLLNVFVCK